jgi:hypothetical protein
MGNTSFSDSTVTLGMYRGVASTTPKYSIKAGRDTISEDLTVARMYLPISTAQDINPKSPFTIKPGVKKFFNGKSGAYVGFLLSQVTESKTEKAEVIPLVGDGFASYFFGQNPRTYMFDGFLLNTKECLWRDLFDYLYKEVFRGSKVAKHSKLVRIAYDGRIVSGVMTAMSQVLSSQNELYSQFQFSLLVFDEISTLDDSSDFDTTYGEVFSGESNTFRENALEVLPLRSELDFTRTASIARPPLPRKSRGRHRKVDCRLRLEASEVRALGTSAAAVGEALRSDSVIAKERCDIVQSIRGTKAKINDLKRKKTTAKTEKERLALGKEQAPLERLLAELETSDTKKVRDAKNAATTGVVGASLDRVLDTSGDIYWEIKREVGPTAKTAASAATIDAKKANSGSDGDM